jgi:hypothetical protein
MHASPVLPTPTRKERERKSPHLNSLTLDTVDYLRLLALMDLYIHPLYVLVSKILFSILNSPALIHPLYHPLSTLFIVGPTYHFI